MTAKVDEQTGFISQLQSMHEHIQNNYNKTNQCTQFIEQTIANDYLFRKLTSYNREEFDELYTSVEPQFLDLTSRGTKRKRKYYNELVIPYKQQLFITLVWLWQYPSGSIMSAMFGIFTWKLADIFTHTILAINQPYEKLIQWC